jgi:hypothetical protein
MRGEDRTLRARQVVLRQFGDALKESGTGGVIEEPWRKRALLRREILAVRPASRRMSAKVRIFIEHLEKTFALCFQFNSRPS